MNAVSVDNAILALLASFGVAGRGVWERNWFFFFWGTWEKTCYRNHLCVTNRLSPKETHFIMGFSKGHRRIEATDGKGREERRKQCLLHPTTGDPRDLV